MKVYESFEQLNKICCVDTQEHYETLVQEDGRRLRSYSLQNFGGNFIFKMIKLVYNAKDVVWVTSSRAASRAASRV